tara:strand:- start:3546 stop:4121 length:576 start_codon:yes stop_codon:yes gene_type:complete
MRVVVVIYPVPARSVFCVVCFFLFFLLLQFTQKFFGEFNILDTPFYILLFKIPKSFDETFGAFSFGENTHETGEEDILPKKKKRDVLRTSLFSFPSSHIKRALQCARTYLLRVKMATSSAFIVQPNFLIKRNVFTVRFFTPARTNHNFSCHRLNPFFVCDDASNFRTYKLTLTFTSLSLSFRTLITTHVGV